jgi:hypothetical protein
MFIGSSGIYVMDSEPFSAKPEEPVYAMVA